MKRVIMGGQEDKRAIYRRLRNKYRRLNGGKTPIITESELFVEQELDNAKSTYEFDVRKNGNEAVVETKLDDNDVFVITSMGLFIYQRLDAEPGALVLQTYPNVTHFALTGGSNFDASDLEAVYNGHLSIKVETTTFLENYPTRKFRYVPDSQEGEVISTHGYVNAASADAEDINLRPHSSWDGEKGFLDVTPNIALNGRKNNEIKLTIPSFSTINITHDGTGVSAMVVFNPQGFLIKSAARGQ